MKVTFLLVAVIFAVSVCADGSPDEIDTRMHLGGSEMYMRKPPQLLPFKRDMLLKTHPRPIAVITTIVNVVLKVIKVLEDLFVCKIRGAKSGLLEFARHGFFSGVAEFAATFLNCIKF